MDDVDTWILAKIFADSDSENESEDSDQESVEVSSGSDMSIDDNVPGPSGIGRDRGQATAGPRTRVRGVRVRGGRGAQGKRVVRLHKRSPTFVLAGKRPMTMYLNGSNASDFLPFVYLFYRLQE